MLIRRLLFLFLLAVGTVGCAVRSASVSGDLPPYDLTIEETRNDGQSLRVLGKITAGNEPLILDGAVLQLRGMNGINQKTGRVLKVTENFLPQDKLSVQTTEQANILLPRQAVRCLIDVPAKNITDYQLELVWSTFPEPRLAIESVTSSGDQCGKNVCKVSYSVDASLKIPSATISEGKPIIIASGVVEKSNNVDLKGLIPENEEEIEVPVSAADSAGEIALRIRVVQELESGTSSAHVPQLRVLESRQ